jgi:hypothetical protein
MVPGARSLYSSQCSASCLSPAALGLSHAQDVHTDPQLLTCPPKLLASSHQRRNLAEGWEQASGFGCHGAYANNVQYSSAPGSSSENDDCRFCLVATLQRCMCFKRMKRWLRCRDSDSLALECGQLTKWATALIEAAATQIPGRCPGCLVSELCKPVTYLILIHHSKGGRNSQPDWMHWPLV